MYWWTKLDFRFSFDLAHLHLLTLDYADDLLLLRAALLCQALVVILYYKRWWKQCFCIRTIFFPAILLRYLCELKILLNSVLEFSFKVNMKTVITRLCCIKICFIFVMFFLIKRKPCNSSAMPCFLKYKAQANWQENKLWLFIHWLCICFYSFIYN